jgi:hypothetical protein
MFSEAVFGRKPLQIAIGFAACNRENPDLALLPDFSGQRFPLLRQSAIQRLIGWTVSLAKAYYERSETPLK